MARDVTELLNWLLKTRTPLPNKVFKQQTGPLILHASYSREQITLALQLGSFESPINSREGILHVPGRKLDLFFADINKNEVDFSPTTMNEDYAITDRLFHTGKASPRQATPPRLAGVILSIKHKALPRYFLSVTANASPTA